LTGLEEVLREINKKLSDLSNKIENSNNTVNLIKTNQEALQEKLLIIEAGDLKKCSSKFF
jgi:uncharacterized protein YlxW (UPF0749 family)